MSFVNPLVDLSNEELLRRIHSSAFGTTHFAAEVGELKSRGFSLKDIEETRPGPTSEGIVPPIRPSLPLAPLPHAVFVRDFTMPFGSMVVFMMKWSFAAIPAFIVLFVFWYLLLGLLRMMAG